MYKSNKRRAQPGNNKNIKAKKTLKNTANKHSKENRTDFEAHKAPKNLENKIARERITRPMGFFAGGIKSKVVRKNSNDYVSNKESYNFLNENLHALLQSVPGTAKENSKKFTETGTSSCDSPRYPDAISETRYKSAADYLLQLQSKQDDEGESLEIVHEDKLGNGSIFQRINQEFLHTQSSSPTSDFDQDGVRRGSFCTTLEQQLSLVSLNSRMAKSMVKIKSLIAKINDVLDGKNVEDQTSIGDLKQGTFVAKQQNVIIDKMVPSLIPKFKWSYDTPNNRQVRRTAVVPAFRNTSSHHQITKPFILERNENKFLFQLEALSCGLSPGTPVLTPPSNFTIFSGCSPMAERNVLDTQDVYFKIPHIRVDTFYSKRVADAAIRNVPAPADKKSSNTSDGVFKFQPEYKNEKQNFRWTNKEEPTRLRVQKPESFTLDQSILMPEIPQLSEPAPLKFYPRKCVTDYY